MLLNVAAAAHELGVSRSKMFELIKSGEIPSLLVGPKIRRVPRAALEEYVARKLAEQAAAVADLAS